MTDLQELALDFLYILIFSYIGMNLQVIIHETGHLLGGLHTGYKFVSYRIGSLVWIKNREDELELRKQRIPGTAGQCLMCPPDLEPEVCPYLLYEIMGGAANLVTGLIGIGFAFACSNHVLTLFWTTFGLAGIFSCMINLIPRRVHGVANDGYNIRDKKNNMFARKCFNLVLSLNAALTTANSFEDLPEKKVNELMAIDFTQADLSNSSIANAFYFQIYFKLIRKQYDDVYKSSRYIEDNPNVMEYIKNSARCECLYYELMHGVGNDFIDMRYDKELQRFIRANMYDPYCQRVMYAYYRLHDHNDAKAYKCIRKLEKIKDTYVHRVGVMFEIELAIEVDELIRKRNT